MFAAWTLPSACPTGADPLESIASYILSFPCRRAEIALTSGQQCLMSEIALCAPTDTTVPIETREVCSAKQMRL